MSDLPTVVRSLPPQIGYEEPSNASDVELREYWRILVKYRKLLVAIVLGFFVVSLIIAFTRTPLYTATARLRIGSYDPILPSTQVEDILQQRTRESNFMETQVRELESRSLVGKILEDEQLFRVFAQDKTEIDEKVIKRYLEAVKVNPVRRTSLVDIQVTLKDADVAAAIANAHVDSFIEWTRDSRVEQQSRGIQYLKSQAGELRNKVASLEREMAQYAEDNSIVALNKDENITAQKLSRLNQLLTDTTAKRIVAEKAYEEALAGHESGRAGVEDQSTQSLRTELGRLEAEYRQLGEKFTSEYPRMKQLSGQIAGLKKAIDGQQGQIITGLKAKMEAARSEEAQLKEELELQKSQAFELSRSSVQYNILNRELETSRELLDSILKQIKELSVSVESNASNISVVDYALSPLSPSYPRKSLFVAIGLILGVVVAIASAFLLSYIDNTVKTPEELTQFLRLPSLGVIPSFDLEKVAGDNQNLPALKKDIVFLKDPKSLAAEAYRTIRTGILLSQAGEAPRTILVTSAQSGEGKTTTALNLAACLASSGGRVVLLDADLRRPNVLKTLEGQNSGKGLVELLTGQAKLDEVMRTDVLKRVSVITSGRVPPNPAELLGSQEMSNLLRSLDEHFDYVLIDSPPVLPVTDSVILSRIVDGVVLVVKGGATPKKVVFDAKKRLSSVGAQILGVVLNDVNILGGDYYYYNRYYYSYYNEETAQAQGS